MTSFSELLLPRWRKIARQMWTEQTGIDCSNLSDEATDKIAAELARDCEDDD
jgi:3-hydroxyisobutyrate dehydrogenase-like beta-hydroxyacid dehydrogenase